MKGNGIVEKIYNVHEVAVSAVLKFMMNQDYYFFSSPR